MGRLIVSLALFIVCSCTAVRALAEDGWDMPDALSAAAAARQADEDAAAKADPAASADKADTKTSDTTPAERVSVDQQPAQHTPPVRGGESAPNNILGPLWGVPADSPVMQNIDPEAEKQYAVNGEGRLVPHSGNDEDEMKSAAEVDKERQRSEAKAAKEKQRADEKAERERQRAEEKAQRDREREASKSDGEKQRDAEKDTEAQPAPEPAPEANQATDVKTAAAADGADERETGTTGCRTTPEQQGW